MPLKILIIPDKFKGTLSAQAAAEAIARGWRKVRPADELELLPMSDGGDGFGEVISRLVGGQTQKIETVDAAHQPCQSQWWWEPHTKTAIIESARVIGLAQLPPGKYHPFDLDTFGLGAVLQAARKKRARRCIIGIGGSATNDGGLGLARALGWKFLDKNGDLIERWIDLPDLAKIRPPKIRKLFGETLVAVDVQNRLLGQRGASRIYGPQKGLRPDDIPRAERCLRRLARSVSDHLGRDYGIRPGSGAAGGLGFGLLAFLRAQAEPGFDLFARYAKLDQRLRASDLVITGEGALDSSSLMGKGVGEIARRCRSLKLRCYALAGKADSSTQLDRYFAAVLALTPELTTETEAKAKPSFWLERAAAQATRQLNNLRTRRQTG